MIADARRKLLPDVLASEGERSKADEKTVEQARSVRSHARALNATPKVTTRSWAELRKCLGETQDRPRALGIVSAATGYEPLPKQLAFHLAGAPGKSTTASFMRRDYFDVGHL